MNTASIIPFHRPPQSQAAEKEKTLDTLKYKIAVATLDRLRRNKEISDGEFEIGRDFLARRFNQINAVRKLK